MNFKQIYEGWRNNLVPPAHMKEAIETVSKERMDICRNCVWFSGNRKLIDGYKSMRPDEHCTDCGCTLSAKTKCLSCSCPKSKWLEIAEDSIDDELNNLK